jgi:hypothetical protein
MARNDEANDIMAQTSFLYGGNAHYIEDMYARFQDDPGSVPAEWHAFFADLKDDPEQIRKSAAGASWKQANWPVQANGELVSALDGNWGAVEKAVSDKLKGKAKQAGSRWIRCVRTGDARFGARHHDDPRLPHARPPALQISIRWACARRTSTPS